MRPKSARTIHGKGTSIRRRLSRAITSWWSDRFKKSDAPRPIQPRGISLCATTRRKRELLCAGDGAASDINHGSAVLRFADARAGLNERIREALADGRDHRAIHALLHHLGLDRIGPPFGESLIVAERADRIGVACDNDSYRSAVSCGFHRPAYNLARFRCQVRLVEIEEHHELARWQHSRRRRWRRGFNVRRRNITRWRGGQGSRREHSLRVLGAR